MVAELHPAPATGPDTAPSMSSLVSGIISDAQQLIRQEINLARREVREELNKAKTAALSMAAGAGLTALGGILFALTLVYVLVALGLPVWAGYAIVAAVITSIGVALLIIGRAKASQVSVIPPQTAESLKENAEWIQNQT
jgi:hypothetical protein